MDPSEEKKQASLADHAFLSPRSQARYGIKIPSNRLAPSDQDPRSSTGFLSSNWAISRQAGKWKKNQTKKVEFDQLVQESMYKEYLKKHELELKSKLPLPLITAMQLEVLHILESCFKDYQRYLGTQHNLSQQMEHRIRELRRLVQSKCLIEEVYEGQCHHIVQVFRQFLGTS